MLYLKLTSNVILSSRCKLAQGCPDSPSRFHRLPTDGSWKPSTKTRNRVFRGASRRNLGTLPHDESDSPEHCNAGYHVHAEAARFPAPHVANGVGPKHWRRWAETVSLESCVSVTAAASNIVFEGRVPSNAVSGLTIRPDYPTCRSEQEPAAVAVEGV